MARQESPTGWVNAYRSNSDTDDLVSKPAWDPDTYQARTASPLMAALDQMPKAYRELLDDIDVHTVWKAFRRGVPPKVVRMLKAAETVGWAKGNRPGPR
jgi:hypothetical protein